MTRTKTTWVALLLTAVLLCSSATGTVAAADLDAYGADEEISDNGNYWVGQTLLYESSTIQNDSTVRLIYAGNDSLVKELPVDNGVVTLDTSSRVATDYYLETSNGTHLVSFSLSVQSISSSVSDGEVKNDGPDTTTNVTLDSERNQYDVSVASVGRDGETVQLSKDALGRLFQGKVVFRDYDSDGDDEAILRNVSSTEDIKMSFDGFKAGEYSFLFTATDVDAHASVGISVKEARRASGQFGNQFIETHRGNTVKIPLELEHTDTANITIGGPEMGYTANVTVRDGGGQNASADGTVTLLFDTALAGHSSDNRNAVRVNGSDSIVHFEETSLTNQLDSAQYLLSMNIDGREAALSALKVKPIRVTGAQTMVIPHDTPPSSYDSFNATKPVDGTISTADSAVIHFGIQGMGKYIAQQDGAEDFARNSKSANLNYVYLSIIEKNPPKNEEPRRLDVSRLAMYNNPDTVEGLAFVFDPDAYADIKPGKTYEVRLNVMDDNSYVDEDTVLRTNVTFTEARTTLDTRDNAKVSLANRNGQLVRGNTTLAPNSSVTIVARSDGEYPFHREAHTTVGPDGSFNATLDLGNLQLPIGYEYDVFVPQTGENYTGEIVPASEAPGINKSNSTTVNATFSTSATTVKVNEIVQFDASNSTPEGRISSYKWTFQDGTTQTGKVTTHRYQSKGEYYVQLVVTTAEGKQATATQKINVNPKQNQTNNSTVPTPESNETANNTTTGNVTNQTTTTAPGQPGFGVVVALVALVGAALVVTRRE